MTQPMRDPHDVDLRRGIHVIVAFHGVMDSRPQAGVARVRVRGHPGFIAIVPHDQIILDDREEET